MKNKAFTLAETLITLIIIGIIATLTVPTLMRKYEDLVQITAFKQAYSILQNSLKIAITENGPIDTWEGGTNKIKDTLKKYLKVAEDCQDWSHCQNYGHKNEKGWIVFKSLSGELGNLSGSHNQFTYKRSLILKNGMIILNIPPNARYDEAIVIDTNGKKGPNRLGYDIFWIPLCDNQKGLCLATSLGWFNSNSFCTIKKNSVSNGMGCQYWLIRHGNMDYKYRDVSKEW